MNIRKIKKWSVLLLMSVAAYIITYFGTYLIPGHEYLIFELKDFIFAIVSFIFAPVEALIMIFLVSFVEMLTIGDGFFGMLMNVVSSCAFVCTAAIIFRNRRNATGMAISLFAGVAVMTALMLLWNYTMTPLASVSITRNDITRMLIPVFLPFNMIKSLSSAGLTLLLCGPLNYLFKKSGVCTPHKNDELKPIDPVAITISVIVITICVLFVLTYRNVI